MPNFRTIVTTTKINTGIRNLNHAGKQDSGQVSDALPIRPHNYLHNRRDRFGVTLFLE